MQIIKSPRKIFLLLIFPIFFCSNHICAQSNAPIADRIHRKQVKSRLLKYLNSKTWNELFPNRYGVTLKDTINHNPDFYSFSAFAEAAALFPDFLSDADDRVNKRELSAFLANIAQETSGGWNTAPGGYFKWGLHFSEEQNFGTQNYSDTAKPDYRPVPGQSYHGRGPKQLSWNYNYGQFSEAWFGSKDTLLRNPGLLSKDPLLSFASAIWFWMTAQYPKPSCHDIMTGKWVPTSGDIQKGRMPGFGATVNVINGGVECGNTTEQAKTLYRYQYYKFFCGYFHVLPGDNISCSTQVPFGR